MPELVGKGRGAGLASVIAAPRTDLGDAGGTHGSSSWLALPAPPRALTFGGHTSWRADEISLARAGWRGEDAPRSQRSAPRPLPADQNPVQKEEQLPEC